MLKLIILGLDAGILIYQILRLGSLLYTKLLNLVSQLKLLYLESELRILSKLRFQFVL